MIVLYIIYFLVAPTQAKHSNDSLESRVNVTALRVDSINVLTTKLTSESESLQQRFKYVESELNRTRNNSRDSKIGSIFIALGLVLEILGATSLAGSFLGRNFVNITDFENPISASDLATIDPHRDSLLWMIGLLGLFLVILGFTAQFIGSLFALVHSWVMTIVPLTVVLICIIALLSYLVKLDPDQKPRNKIQILLLNIKRFTYLWFSNKMRCDYCAKLLTIQNAEVWWYKDTIHPKFFHLGHPSCLALLEIYNLRGCENEIVKSNPKQFLKEDKTLVEKLFIENPATLPSTGSFGQSKFHFRRILNLLNKELAEN